MKSKSITSVTFILIGNMLLIYNNIGSGWTTSVTAILGIILFFVGLSRLKTVLDQQGKNGVSKLIWAAVLVIFAAAFSYLPIVGLIPAGILNFIAFILQIVGFINLKNSKTLGRTGAEGVNYLLVAMVLTIIASLLGIIPILGKILKPAISFIAFILIPFGWIKVQEAIIEYSGATGASGIRSGNELKCSNCGKEFTSDMEGGFCEECGNKLIANRGINVVLSGNELKCSMCGKEFSPDMEGGFCEECGNKL